MKERDVHAELSSIRELMERSSKFISLSGLSGILAGVYALLGARMAFRILTNHTEIGAPAENVPVITRALIVIALIVLILSIVTSYWLTLRKTKRRNEKVWNPVSRRLLEAMSIPMITGGLCIVIMVLQKEYILIPALFLVFYGLALVAGSQYTFQEVKWLGLVDILLGLCALLLPEYGLVFWSVGFGLLHILYGTFMHFKYER